MSGSADRQIQALRQGWALAVLSASWASGVAGMSRTAVVISEPLTLGQAGSALPSTEPSGCGVAHDLEPRAVVR